MSEKKNILKLILAVILFFPVYAHAYLDPGTGSALVAAIFELLGSLLFFSKNFYYKIKSKFKGEKLETVKPQLAFFQKEVNIGYTIKIL
jgi:hypothetical protein